MTREQMNKIEELTVQISVYYHCYFQSFEDGSNMDLEVWQRMYKEKKKALSDYLKSLVSP